MRPILPRLRECEDAPVVLFFKGNVDLNRLHVINMVGTRRATEYGKQFCADFLHDLSALLPDVLVVSGLAYGIDIHAHRAALANDISTVAVLAHGLDRIYPRFIAKRLLICWQMAGCLRSFSPKLIRINIILSAVTVLWPECVMQRL